MQNQIGVNGMGNPNRFHEGATSLHDGVPEHKNQFANANDESCVNGCVEVSIGVVRMHKYWTHDTVITVRTLPGEAPEDARNRVFKRIFGSAHVHIGDWTEIYCEGCISDSLGQKSHMNPGGCRHMP